MNYFTSSILVSTLTIGGLGLPNLAQGDNTNSQNLSGWSRWYPRSEVSQANFSAGFSNLELGGFLDFKYACAEAMEIPSDQVQEVPYRFRVSDLVTQIGTGKVEYGCFVDAQPVFNLTITAVNTRLENVTCLRVASPIGNGLIIRSEATTNSQRLGVVANGQVVNPGSYPASVTQADGRNWVYILSPQRGWVSQGQLGSRGNLKLCQSETSKADYENSDS